MSWGGGPEGGVRGAGPSSVGGELPKGGGGDKKGKKKKKKKVLSTSIRRLRRTSLVAQCVKGLALSLLWL